MKKLIPLPKVIKEHNGKTKTFTSLYFSEDMKERELQIQTLIINKMWNYKDIALCFDHHPGDNGYCISISSCAEIPEGADEALFAKQGYTLCVGEGGCEIGFISYEGLVNALSTLKQLFEKLGSGYSMACCEIIDWPSIELRSISNTFAWYAGYGRFGFDMQLWGYDEWVEYVNICSDFKINQFNMCMYGYWPFEFEEYPETVLRNMQMKVWNKESKNWVAIEFIHPNLADEFLSKLIDYGHQMGIRFYAYVGLNSYSGGYPSEHKEKRMKLPQESKYVNDFDRLCLSDADSMKYLEKSIRRIVRLGYDGVDFEESEEAFWYCNCAQCEENFIQSVNTPEQASHIANNKLLKTLYQAIKEENPDCKIGLRAWRQPPLEKPVDVMQEMVSSVPEDIGLFWAPGLYVPDSEFEKWVNAFGRERIWGRDTESNAVSSCFGRLIRTFRSNGLRCEEETNDQFLEEDIRQHIGSAQLGVKGINGYMFEWYGFFIHLFAHAFYGWGSQMEHEAFYQYSVEAVFGEDLADDILYVLKNMFTIHESQLGIFPTEFPFARNKVEQRDVPRIQQAIEDWPNIMKKIDRVQQAVAADDQLCVYEPHFEKLRIANERNRVIYDLALASIAYDHAITWEEKQKYLLRMLECNERDFDIVKNNSFDVNPVEKAGIKSCMIPCHELKRVIMNELDPDHKDEEPIYLGVEALGWLWL